MIQIYFRTTVKPPNSGYVLIGGQNFKSQMWQSFLNYLSIAENFFKTRTCPLYRRFTVYSFASVCLPMNSACSKFKIKQMLHIFNKTTIKPLSPASHRQQPQRLTPRRGWNPLRVPTYVERAENNIVSEKIKCTFRRS